MSSIIDEVVRECREIQNDPVRRLKLEPEAYQGTLVTLEGLSKIAAKVTVALMIKKGFVTKEAIAELSQDIS